MVEITALSNERMRAALELLSYKMDKMQDKGCLWPDDVDEVLMVAGLNVEKELDVL